MIDILIVLIISILSFFTLVKFIICRLNFLTDLYCFLVKENSFFEYFILIGCE